MKGQRLFIRPIEPGDEPALREFLDRHADPSAVPACGLLGKLVGDLVALVAMRITTDSVEIDKILVDKDLRRKRIGRALIDEAEQIAARIECAQLVAADPGSGGSEFLRRAGFDKEENRWIRQVRAGNTKRQ